MSATTGQFIGPGDNMPKKILPPCPSACDPLVKQYLAYCEASGRLSGTSLHQTRRVIGAFSHFLQAGGIGLAAVGIEQVDGFLKTLCAALAQSTSAVYRSCLRGFLRYLYHQCAVLPKDLAALVTGPPMFAKSKPPRFLRPHQVKALFDGLHLNSAGQIRAFALVHLAYFLGLRPREISLIQLDDIDFDKAELTIKSRKNNQPAILPLPECVLKAVVAYIVGARPDSDQRRLFLSRQTPYRPMYAGTVAAIITGCMKAAGLSASAYWLRFTHAQNLLEAGASVYEIKEMLGHQSIQHTGGYLHIHVQLMRQVLFDETL